MFIENLLHPQILSSSKWNSLFNIHGHSIDYRYCSYFPFTDETEAQRLTLQSYRANGRGRNKIKTYLTLSMCW